MEILDNIIGKSLNNYFITLSQYGYVSYSKVNQILSLIFIKDILDNFDSFITDKDYTIIVKALNCLYGSNCAIEIPSYITYDSIIKSRKLKEIRTTEDNLIRISNDKIRIEN